MNNWNNNVQRLEIIALLFALILMHFVRNIPTKSGIRLIQFNNSLSLLDNFLPAEWNFWILNADERILFE